MKTLRTIFFLIFLFSLFASACGNSNEPARVVESYLAGKVAQDEEVVRSLLCSEMEDSFEMELYSFASASDATIVDMVCKLREGVNIVDCTGTIKASYGGEANEFPLSSYRVVEEESGWKWCGEAP